MPNLNDKSEVDAYYLADPAHPRAAGVMWPALVERRVDKLFETALRPDKVVRNELFQSSGALGNYGVKVRLAYLLGWIEKDFYDDLILISKIRNRFAHDISATDFSDSRIAGWLKKMKSYQQLPSMLKIGKKRVLSEPTSSNRLYVNIVEDAIENRVMGFRFCIDLMLHHLEKCRSAMEKNLAELPGNWLVSDKK